MHAVKMRLLAVADEKLRSASVATCVSHAKAATLVLYLLIIAFAFYPPARTACACAIWAAALDDEIWYNSVKI